MGFTLTSQDNGLGFWRTHFCTHWNKNMQAKLLSKRGCYNCAATKCFILGFISQLVGGFMRSIWSQYLWHRFWDEAIAAIRCNLWLKTPAINILNGLYWASCEVDRHLAVSICGGTPATQVWYKSYMQWFINHQVRGVPVVHHYLGHQTRHGSE